VAGARGGARVTRLTARAPGKVNLCLFVGASRADGLHPLVSIFQSVSLADELALEPAPPGATADEVVCPGVPGENLAARALAAYRAATGWDAPPQRLTIAKRVPVAGGMGGGSGDAAAALRLAAHAAGRPQDPRLPELAFPLGADVPSQLAPGRALVTGAGEHVEPLPPPPEVGLVIVPAAGQLSTPKVYAEADRLGTPRASLDGLVAEVRAAALAAPVPPPALAVNDLEPAALSLAPALARTLAALRAAGAAPAMVSGSGPTAFGAFPTRAAAEACAARIPGALVAVPVDAAFAAVEPAGG